MDDNNRPPKGIFVLIFIMLGLLCLKCDEPECDVEGRTRCGEEQIIERCNKDGYWEDRVDCKLEKKDGGHCKITDGIAKCYGI